MGKKDVYFTLSKMPPRLQIPKYHLDRSYYCKSKKELVMLLATFKARAEYFENESKYFQGKYEEEQQRHQQLRDASRKLEQELLDLGDDGYFDPYSPPNSPTSCALDLAEEVEVINLTETD